MNSYEVLEHLVLKFVDYEIVEELSTHLKSGKDLFKAKCKSEMKKALRAKNNTPEMDVENSKQFKKIKQEQFNALSENQLEKSEILDPSKENELEHQPQNQNDIHKGMIQSSSTELIQKNINFVIEEESEEETPTREIAQPEENFSNGLTSLNIQFPEGGVYDGETNSKGEKHGDGQIVFPNGCVYEGSWENDKASGMGILKLLNGEMYEGEFKNNMSHGFGVFTDSKGGKYEGEWEEDLQHGYGVETWANGTKFQGHYKRGMKDGLGLIEFDDKCIYDGDFSENHISGYGKFIWTDGRVYEGQWDKNSMNGLIRLTYKDGRFFQGFYIDDEKYGKGVSFYPSTEKGEKGRFVFGEWKSGKIEGEGVEILEDGTRTKGLWINGEKFTTFKNPDKNGMKEFILDIVKSVKMKKFTIKLPKPKSLQVLGNVHQSHQEKKDATDGMLFDSFVKSEQESELLFDSLAPSDPSQEATLVHSNSNTAGIITNKSNMKHKLKTIKEVPNSPNLETIQSPGYLNFKKRVAENEHLLSTSELDNSQSNFPDESPDSSFEQKAKKRTSFFGFECVEDDYDFQKSMKGEYMPITERDFSKKLFAEKITDQFYIPKGYSSSNPKLKSTNRLSVTERSQSINKSSSEYQLTKHAYGLRTSRSKISLNKTKSRSSLKKGISLSYRKFKTYQNMSPKSARKSWYRDKLYTHRQNFNPRKFFSEGVEAEGHRQFIQASKSVGNLLKLSQDKLTNSKV